MDGFLQAETLVIELLLVVALVAIGVRRLRLPYTVVLVVVGLALTTQQPLQISLTPDLILALFVPPLVFEAAFHLSAQELRRVLVTVLTLAVPGVMLTTLIVGGLTTWLTPLSWPLALVFGALIAATDPVAVVALFRQLGVPHRLAVLVEAESLLNDGTAIVLFNLVIAAALTGQINPTDSLAQFARVAIGGLGLGLLLGWVVAWLIARVDDYLIETTLTTVLAFGSYLLAERLHVSGVLAVVAAGLLIGNVGPRGMSPTTRIVLFNFWEYVAFLANSLVFLLIGLQIDLTVLAADWQPILGAVVAVLAARLVVVYGLGALVNRLVEPVPLAWQHVLSWGGLRGAISLALVLSLPSELGEQRGLLLTMTFGVVLFTLLVQGTTMGLLPRRLGLLAPGERRLDYARYHARLVTLRAAATQLESQHRDGLVADSAWEQLRSEITERTAALTELVEEVLRAQPRLADEELATARRELLRAERSALVDLRRDGVISEEVFGDLARELDDGLIASPTAAERADQERQR